MEPTPSIPSKAQSKAENPLIPLVEKEFPKYEKLERDDRGFYMLSSGSFWDLDFKYFNHEGYDIHGGHYDEYGEYHPGPGWNDKTEVYDDEQHIADPEKSEEILRNAEKTERPLIDEKEVNIEEERQNLAIDSDDDDEFNNEVEMTPQEQQEMEGVFNELCNEQNENEANDDANAQNGKINEAQGNNECQIKENFENKV